MRVCQEIWIPLVMRQVRKTSESGTEFSYRVLFPGGFAGDREAAAERTLGVLLDRARRAGLEAEGSVKGPDRVALRIAIEGSADFGDLKRLLGRHVGFGLYAAAPRDVQDRYNDDRVAPPGYTVWKNENPHGSSEYAPWGKPLVLLGEEPVVGGRHVVAAEPREFRSIRGTEWMVSFDLDAEGSRRFDEAAKTLYHRRPPGMIAIVYDGSIRSMPAVMAEAFGGHGQISGLGRDEARELAALLAGGGLPFPVGRIVDGKPVAGEPETEIPYGPGK